VIRGPGDVTEIPVPDIHEDLTYTPAAYLGELPGYDISVPLQRAEGRRAEQASTDLRCSISPRPFTQLAVSLGHIFKVESG